MASDTDSVWGHVGDTKLQSGVHTVSHLSLYLSHMNPAQTLSQNLSNMHLIQSSHLR